VATPEAAPPSSGAVPGAGVTTILYAEDEEAVRGVTARILVRAGYRVLVAKDGPDALALSDHERGELSLLVTDVVMPGLDGRALADELRRRRGPLRVLYLSGYTQEVISHAGVLDPSIRFLAKPYSAEALLAEVRGALAGTARRASVGEESRVVAQTPGG
jgi:CheY-like chemotaxis protein